MDFGTPILAVIALVTTLFFKVLVICVGLGCIGFSHHSYKTTGAQFFSLIEIVSGLIWLFSDLLWYFADNDSAADEAWVRNSMAATVWLMTLAVAHCIEIRKPLAAPTLIFGFGIVNLYVLRYMKYLLLVYEAAW